MYTKPPPGDTDGPATGRRRLLAWLGGLGAAGLVGSAVAPLADPISPASATPATGDGLVGQRLVYAHHESGERAVGGHTHDDDLYARAADFARPSALDAVLTYPERLVGEESYAVLLHRLRPDTLGAPTVSSLTADGFVAYGATCTHCGTLLRWDSDAGEAGLDICPYDGCQFDPRHGGQPVTGPAETPLPQLGVRLTAAGAFELTTGFPAGEVDA